MFNCRSSGTSGLLPTGHPTPIEPASNIQRYGKPMPIPIHEGATDRSRGQGAADNQLRHRMPLLGRPTTADQAGTERTINSNCGGASPLSDFFEFLNNTNYVIMDCPRRSCCRCSGSSWCSGRCTFGCRIPASRNGGCRAAARPTSRSGRLAERSPSTPLYDPPGSGAC